MGFLSAMCKLTAVVVLLVSLLVGSLFSDDTNVLKKLGVFRYFDSYVGSRGAPFWMGMFPAMHEGTPWGFQASDIPDLTNQTILVTGGNAGLGYWSAYHLASHGANVVITCRSAGKCAAAAKKLGQETGHGVSTGLLDLASFESIRSFAAAFRKQHSSIDSLMLNAGLMTPQFGTTKEGIEIHMGTNHFGHFLLTELLMPLLEASVSTTPTVVVVSSASSYDSFPEGVRLTLAEINDPTAFRVMTSYGQSKLANVLFAQELASRVADKGIVVNSCHPGNVETEVSGNTLDFIKSKAGEQVAAFIKENLLPRGGRGVWRAEDGALTQVFLAVSPTVRTNKITGKYFHPVARETVPDLHAFNKTLQQALWDLSAEVVATH